MRREITVSIIIFFLIISLVVGIIILALVLLKPSQTMAKLRDQQRLADVSKIQTALQLYLADGRNFDELSNAQIYSSLNGATNTRGQGWVPLDFLLTSGDPFNGLPIDPLNDSVYHYEVAVNVSNKTFEIDCHLEDVQNQARMANDQGNNKMVYEVGDDLSILK